jgi:hypothetical protein
MTSDPHFTESAETYLVRSRRREAMFLLFFAGYAAWCVYWAIHRHYWWFWLFAAGGLLVAVMIARNFRQVNNALHDVRRRPKI